MLRVTVLLTPFRQTTRDFALLRNEILSFPMFCPATSRGFLSPYPLNASFTFVVA